MDDWLKEHRELQYLRSVAASTPFPRRSKKAIKGLARKSPKEQARYIEERDRKRKNV